MDVTWLENQGLSNKRAAYLASSGWLTRIGRGVYMRPGDTLNRDACLALLSKNVVGLHVAGKTALEWRGVRHNLQFKEKLVLWSEKHTKLPEWFSERFPHHYQATHIFDESMPHNLGLSPLPNGRPDVLVSSLERALLELLSDAGKGQSLEETRHLAESVRNLRQSVLDELLSHLNRIKVVRLAYALADEFNLPWRSLTEKHSERLGGSERWVTVSRTGEFLALKRKINE